MSLLTLTTSQEQEAVRVSLAGELDLPDGVTAEPFLDDEIVGIAAPGQLTVRRGRAPLRRLADRTLLVREHGSSTRAARRAPSVTYGSWLSV